MYAVIASGGKQYRVAAGDTVKLETLAGGVGDEVVLDKVLMVGEGEKVTVGKPYVENGNVKATILGHGRGKKIKIIKFKRRKHHMKRQGHRQNFTEVKIEAIQGN